MESELGIKLPVYKPKGCYFRIGPDNHSITAVELKAFTTALAGCLAQVQSTGKGGFDQSQMWRAARESGATTIELDPIPV